MSDWLAPPPGTPSALGPLLRSWRLLIATDFFQTRSAAQLQAAVVAAMAKAKGAKKVAAAAAAVKAAGRV